jgi:transposase
MSRLRYPSDMSDAEWSLMAPLILSARRGRRPLGVNRRKVLNAILYVLAIIRRRLRFWPSSAPSSVAGV